MLATIHLSAAVSVPGALALAALGLWFMRQPTDPEGPPARRLIRQLSMSVRILLLVPMVIGLSFADPDLAPLRYAWAWGVAALLLLLSVLIAGLDVAHSLAHVARQQSELDLQTFLREEAGEEA